MNNPSLARTIPFLDLKGTGQVIHFSHANGYPPACYKPFLSQFQNVYKIISMLQRPLWEGSDPNDISDWHVLSEDILNFLDQQSFDSVIGIGHSVGGIATLRAAINYPDRFKALIIIDPVLLTPLFIFLRRLLKSENLVYRFHPLIKKTLQRRREFSNLEDIFNGYRKKQIFRYMDDLSLKAYISGITTPASNGKFKLLYSPEWEVKIYATGIWNDFDLWKGLSTIKIPVLLIRGNESDTFLPSATKLIRKKLSNAKIITLYKSTHLVPLERPKMSSRIIMKFLEENL